MSAIVSEENVDSIEAKFKKVEPGLRQKDPTAVKEVKLLFDQLTYIWESPKLPANLEVRVDELHERIKNYVAAVNYLGPLESSEEVKQRVEGEFISRQKEVKGGAVDTPSPYGTKGGIGGLKQSNLFSVSPSPASRLQKSRKTTKKLRTSAKSTPRNTFKSTPKQDHTPMKAFPIKTTPRFVRLGGHPARKSSAPLSTPQQKKQQPTPSSNTKRRTVDLELPSDPIFDAFETPTNTPKQAVNMHSKRKKRKPLPTILTRDVTPDAKKKLDIFNFKFNPFDPYEER